MDWTPEEYARLAEHYRDLPDERLLALARTPDELTPLAGEVLRTEMAERHLSAAPDDETEHLPEVTDEIEWDGDLWRDYAMKAPEECTFFYESRRKANDAAAFLGESKVEGFVLADANASFDLRGPRVVVKPQDAERAAKILSQPIPAHIADEPEVDVKDFAAPECPACGAPDPLLESADPVNAWLCEECGHTWKEEAA